MRTSASHRRAARAVHEARGDGVAALCLHHAVAGHDRHLRRVGGRHARQDPEHARVGARLDRGEALVVAAELRLEPDLRGFERERIEVAARRAPFDEERIADGRLDLVRAEARVGEEADPGRRGRRRHGDAVGVGVGDSTGGGRSR